MPTIEDLDTSRMPRLAVYRLTFGEEPAVNWLTLPDKRRQELWRMVEEAIEAGEPIPEERLREAFPEVATEEGSEEEPPAIY